MQWFSSRKTAPQGTFGDNWRHLVVTTGGRLRPPAGGGQGHCSASRCRRVTATRDPGPRPRNPALRGQGILNRSKLRSPASPAPSCHAHFCAGALCRLPAPLTGPPTAQPSCQHRSSYLCCLPLTSCRSESRLATPLHSPFHYFVFLHGPPPLDGRRSLVFLTTVGPPSGQGTPSWVLFPASFPELGHR